jgi:hypothetical protein
MFVYLNRKITMPAAKDNSEITVESVGWHSTRGMLCVGGDKGLVKILKLDDSHKTP